METERKGEREQCLEKKCLKWWKACVCILISIANENIFERNFNKNISKSHIDFIAAKSWNDLQQNGFAYKTQPIRVYKQMRFFVSPHFFSLLNIGKLQIKYWKQVTQVGEYSIESIGFSYFNEWTPEPVKFNLNCWLCVCVSFVFAFVVAKSNKQFINKLTANKRAMQSHWLRNWFVSAFFPFCSSIHFILAVLVWFPTACMLVSWIVFNDIFKYTNVIRIITIKDANNKMGKDEKRTIYDLYTMTMRNRTSGDIPTSRQQRQQK